MAAPADIGAPVRLPATPVQILALNGSLRRGSWNGMLLEAARRALPAHAKLERWAGLAQLPAYSEDDDGARPPTAVRRLRADVVGADALVIATPEYNASVPGALKNALDWASRPYPENALARKPVAVVGASTGLFGAVWAQAEVRKTLRSAGANVVERELPVGRAAEAFAPDGSLDAEEHRTWLAEILGALLELATHRTDDTRVDYTALRARSERRAG